jgi:repressor LexA
MPAPRKSDIPQLSPKQLQVLREVARQASGCYSATIGELAQALNISRPTAFEHLAALRKKNLLTQSAGKARSLHLTPAGEKLLNKSVGAKPNAAFHAAPQRTPACQMPGFTLRGRVSAGYGIEAIEEQTPFSLGEVFGAPGELFVLQVTGKSMINAGIDDGDFVMCRSASVADNGQLVVALIDDDQNATVKRFYRDASAVRLQPENDAFDPILSTDCTIQAVVIGLIRKFKK